MTSVIAGEVSSLFTGVIYCSVLDACLDLTDLGRAGEWNEAALAWCDTLPPDAPFTALCRINRAQLATLRGAWSEAETEARRVSEDQTIDPAAAARGFYETGEILRRLGNLGAAEEAFGRARELGLEPQPGLALLRLGQGKAEPALTALRLAVDGETQNRPRLARLLAALVEIAIAAGDLEIARAAGEDLGTIAAGFGTPALDAAAMTARGALALAEGDGPTALVNLRGACRIWHELRLPYESARARVLYGIALRTAGVHEDAELELRSAISAFERLGAAPEAAAAAALLGGDEHPRGLTAAGGGGVASRRVGQDQPRHRRRARDQRAHGRAASAEHLRQARRLIALGRDRLRVRARSRLTDHVTQDPGRRWSVLTMSPLFEMADSGDEPIASERLRCRATTRRLRWTATVWSGSRPS